MRRAHKTEVWLTDLSGNELLVSKAEVQKLNVGQVVQVENATLLRKADKIVGATAEHLVDSKWHSLTSLSGRKTTDSKDLDSQRGVAISTAWQAFIARDVTFSRDLPSELVSVTRFLGTNYNH